MVDRRQMRAFKALGNESRYQILRTLAGDGSQHCCQELIGQLGLTPPAVSSHLRILENADLIAVERRAGQLFLSLAPNDLAYQMAALVRRGPAA